ncbi:ABC transporter ATP-binding protein [Pontitalea aquivivens]|uniref:ABC transporter ATP-binding protein n=1 Tax=Pontitalea aquivivens TaxID=3388663 RepID=UPI003970784C
MTATDTIIEARSLSKVFNGFAAVKDVDLTVRRNTIHALIGPNGAGKTTMFNLITKFLQPTTGTIRYNGQDITRLRPEEVARRGLVRSFQISAVYPRMTVRENVRIALQRPMGVSYHFWRSEKLLRALDRRVDELLDEVGLTGDAERPATLLSYGRKRALEIATTLALDPEMLLLDEPTSGLGHEDVDRIAALIRKVSAQRTVLMVEHNLSVVAALSNTITVLAAGSVLAEGDYPTVSRDPRVIEAYIGGADD